MPKQGSTSFPQSTTAQRIAQRLKDSQPKSDHSTQTPENASKRDLADKARNLVQTVIHSWQQAGWLSVEGFPAPKSESPKEKANREWRQEAAGILVARNDRLPVPAVSFLEDLKKARGLNPVKVHHLLQGKIPPHIDVIGLYQQWRSLKEWAKKTFGET